MCVLSSEALSGLFRSTVTVSRLLVSTKREIERTRRPAASEVGVDAEILRLDRDLLALALAGLFLGDELIDLILLAVDQNEVILAEDLSVTGREQGASQPKAGREEARNELRQHHKYIVFKGESTAYVEA